MLSLPQNGQLLIHIENLHFAIEPRKRLGLRGSDLPSMSLCQDSARLPSSLIRSITSQPSVLAMSHMMEADGYLILPLTIYLTVVASTPEAAESSAIVRKPARSIA